MRQFFFRGLFLAALLFTWTGTSMSCSSARSRANTQKSGSKVVVRTSTTTGAKPGTAKGTAGKAASGSKSEKKLLESYASKMGVSASKLQAPKLYSVIDQWIGVPYKYGGNTKKGVDCSGFVTQVHRSFTSKAIPRTSAELAKAIAPKPMAKLKEGDLVFFNYDGKNSHVGIYLQNGWFVHASTVKGVVLSDLKATYYKQRYSTGGTLKTGSLADLAK